MEDQLEVDVKIISKEMVKPSFPPLSNPTTFTLPFIDQIFPTFHIPLLLYYTSNPSTQQGEIDISGLKTSLSQTLDQFLPLAGRLMDESTISCNNEGIPLIETKVNCHLSVALTSPHKVKLLPKFLPPPDLQASGLQPISELVPLAFQINVFVCGGVVIGCYMLHKFLDAGSIGTFFRYWSALNSKRLQDLAPPHFEATVNAFPPYPKKEHIPSFNALDLLPHPTQTKLTFAIKSFIFDTSSINILKTKAASKLIYKPTGFEVVLGFLWEHILATKHNLSLQVERTSVTIAVNMRPRMSPPLPRESMGNIIITPNVLVPEESNNNKFQELVKEIHSTLSTTYKKINSRIFQGENAKVELLRSMAPVDGALIVSSWCKMGLNEADFGFGKPIWIVPTDGKQTPLLVTNVCCMTDYCHPIIGDGIEAWLMLEEKEMDYLESNADFLAFASPN
ncbi:vinorine synthase-like [Chenopodium quinoa]|uniref:vinorine synthase-like n=1 Tax=Chenopodium quinoa TaxID=63459 RepID=UPI000B76C6D0|nr:vinorine synthase-like [Chenopodium quinoa]